MFSFKNFKVMKSKLLILFSIFFSLSLQAQVSIGFRDFCCKSTTEWANDEIYFLISAKYSNGNTLDKILPSVDGNIYMNDDKGDHICLGNKLLTTIPLEEGETVVVLLTIMEEDIDSGTTSLRNKALVSNLLSIDTAMNQSDKSIISKLNKLFPTLKKGDDWIGSFKVNITKKDGLLNASWYAVNHINKKSGFKENIEGKNTCFIRLKNHRTKYHGWFWIH